MNDIYQPTLAECLKYGHKWGDWLPDGRRVLPPTIGGSDFRLQDGAVLDGTGRLATSSTGVTITAGSSINTKGAWTQLSASTIRDSAGMLVVLVANTSAAFLVDIGVGGAGSETALVSNLYSLGVSGTTAGSLTFFVPIAIPSGRRLAARCQSTVASGTVRVATTLIGHGFASPVGFGRVTDYGSSTAATSGTTVTASTTANVKGSYSQLVASTANPCAMLTCNFFTNSQGLLDLAVGAAGSEQVIVPDLPTGAYPNPITVPMSLPVGTRISCRWQCAVAGGATMTALVHGID